MRVTNGYETTYDDHRYFSEKPSTKSVTFYNDIFLLEEVFSKKDINKIIENSEFFWLAFCKAFSQIKKEHCEFFSITLHKDTLIISGREHIIFDVRKGIEEVRKLFLKGYTEKSDEPFVILLVEVCHEYFIKEKKETIDLTDWLNDKIKFSEFCFKDYVLPVMQNFCDSLGAICSNAVVSQKILIDSNIKNKNVEALEIKWIQKEKEILQKQENFLLNFNHTSFIKA